jgi:predicted Zn-dependent peptidase
VSGGYGPSTRKADEASLFAYVGTQGDKTQDAIEAVMATLHEPVDDARLGVAREGIVEGHRVERIAPRGIAGSVYAWEDQAEKEDPREARTKRMLALDKAALEKWMKANIGSQLTVSVVGDRKKLDEAKLKKLAPVTFVPVDKLFGY